MRFDQFINERMDVTWVKLWIVNSVPRIQSQTKDVEWFSKFFKNLNQNNNFKQWKSENLKNNLTITPRLYKKPTYPSVIMNAEHYIGADSLDHYVEIEVNLSKIPKDNNDIDALIVGLNGILVHELNHAYQREKQLLKIGDMNKVAGLDTTVFLKKPPEPTNKTEKFYLYLLDELEKDAWVSQLSTEIYNKLGNSSIESLNLIFKQVTRDSYIVIDDKIINLKILKTLYDAVKYYGDYLKGGTAGSWNKIKKNLYTYLKQYDNKLDK